MPARRPLRPLRGLLLLLPACATGPAFPPADLPALAAFQQAARARPTFTTDELFAEARLFELGPDDRLHACDLRGLRVTLRRMSEGVETMLRLRDGTLLPYRSGFARVAADGTGHSVASDGERVYVAAGGAALGGFDSVHTAAWRSDTGEVVVVGRRNGSACLVAGDRVTEGGFFDSSFAPMLSHDGRLLAYVQPGLLGASRWVLTTTDDPLGGERPRMPAGDVIWPVRFSEDSAHWAVVVRGGDGDRLVVDGEVHGPWPAIRHLFPTVHGFYCKLRVADGERLWVDGELWPVVPAVRYTLPGRDGGTGAFVATVDGREQLFVGPDRVHEGGRIGFARIHDRQRWACVEEVGEEQWLVTPGSRHGPYRQVHDVQLSADGERVYWLGFDEGRAEHHFVDGMELPAVAGERRRFVTFLPDGSPLFRVTADGRTSLCTPQARFPAHDTIGTVLVSADGRRAAYVATDGREVWRRVVDLR